MKAFIYLIAATLLIFSCKTKTTQTFVLDNERDLSQHEINSFDSLYKSHQEKTTNEIILITTPDFGTDTSMMLFAVSMGRQYGIGTKEKNNGVVIAFSKTLHQVSIATGLGTEKVLKDEIAKKIIDSVMKPYFVQDKYYDGLWQGSLTIIKFLERPENQIR